MGRDYPEQFDDPALKSAIKRLYSGERAPEDLRKRIERLATAGHLNGSGSPPLADGDKTASLRSSAGHGLNKVFSHGTRSCFLMGLAVTFIA